MVIVKRHKCNEVEVFEISEPELQTFRVASAHAQEPALAKEAIDLYKMEYETCAKRYNDLYSAAWTNFSYMALFAGGILTFGGTRFEIPLTAFLACLPLLFWWVATFEPLNRYGDQVQKDLGDIEKALNALCFLNTSIAGAESGLDKPQTRPKGLTHFQDFANREPSQLSVPKAFAKRLVAVYFFAVFVMFALHTFLNFTIPGWWVIGISAFVILIVLALLLLKFGRKSKLSGTTTVRVREEKHISAEQMIVDGVVITIRDLIPRVRLVVRIAGCLLLITAICFGVKVGQMIQNGRSLTVPKFEAPASDITH
jgi:hypothetical protein